MSDVVRTHGRELEISHKLVSVLDINDSLENLSKGSDDLCFPNAVEDDLAEKYISHAAFEEVFKTY